MSVSDGDTAPVSDGEGAEEDDKDLFADAGPEEHDDGGGEQGGGSQREESVAEKRLRLAKEYLTRIKGDEGDEEDAAEALKGSAAQGRVERTGMVANKGDDAHQRFVRLHKLPPTAIALTSDGSVAYSVGKDGQAFKVDVEAGNIERLHCHSKDGKNALISATCTDDGNVVAAGDELGQVHVWDVRENASQGKCLKGHKGSVTGVCFRRGETSTLLSCSEDRTICVWQSEAAAHVDTLFGHQAGALAVDCLWNDRAASVGRDRTLRTWRTESDKQAILRSAGACPESCAFVAAGQHVATGNDDGTVSLWSTNKRKPVQVRVGAHGPPPEQIAVEAQTSRCKLMAESELRTARKARSLAGAGSDGRQNGVAGGWVQACAGSPGSDLVATGAGDGAIRVWHCNVGAGKVGLERAGEIPARGFANGLKVSSRKGIVVAAMGKEPRCGRWETDKGARNGILIERLSSEQGVESESESESDGSESSDSDTDEE